MMTGFRQFEREFLSLASTWPVCRLAVMGGTPEHPAHVPVTNFDTLGWALLGCKDYGSHSDSRKAASAMIAKIPFELASYVARYYKPCPIDLESSRRGAIREI